MCLCVSKTHFSIVTRGSDLQKKLLVFGVSGILCQLFQYIGTRWGGDVHVVGECCAIGSRAGEGVLLSSRF